MLAFFINRIMCTLRSMCKVYLPYHTMSAVCVCLYNIQYSLLMSPTSANSTTFLASVIYQLLCLPNIWRAKWALQIEKKRCSAAFPGLGCYKNSKILVIILSTEVTLTILSLYLIPEYILIISLHYTKACWRDVTKESYEDKRRSSCVHTR